MPDVMHDVPDIPRDSVVLPVSTFLSSSPASHLELTVRSRLRPNECTANLPPPSKYYSECTASLCSSAWFRTSTSRHMATMEQSCCNSNSDMADPHHNAVDRNSKIDSVTSQHIIAEELESREGMPEYPGLERWMLVEQIGVGAYGDVYRAKDSKDEMPEAAIKVIRKCELNKKQVCNRQRTHSNPSPHLSSSCIQ